MGKIKYEDKLDAIKFRKFRSYDFNVKAKSLDKLVEKIYKSKKYKMIKDSMLFVSIEVECLNSDTWVLVPDIFPDELSVLDAKRLASSIAVSRTIALSPDLTEIYFEKLRIKVGKTRGTLLYFDYGLLYGNYEPLDLNKPLTVNVPWRMYGSDTSYYIIDRLINNPNIRLKTKDLISYEAYYMYGGELCDKYNRIIGWIEEAEDPIPVSLIYKYMERSN